MNTKIFSICMVALLAVGGIGMLAAQPLWPVSGTQVLSRGNVDVEMIGVDDVGYEIWTGTGWGAALVGVKLSFTANIEAGTYIAISVRDSANVELGYYAHVQGSPITDGITTTFYLWNLADELWTGSTATYSMQFPQLGIVDHLIVTVAGNSLYVTSPTTTP
ncbi:MAG TPA: hypothetical protein VMY59_05500 [Candidatus Thermoplasmatota archaeon]|nr:hypothetical protein [Candidatus Thermoplasmatota archaeon]